MIFTKLLSGIVTAALIVAFAQSASYAQDSVEFMSGVIARGKVKQIRKAEKEFDFETQVGDRTYTRTYPFGKVHAATINGKRFELTPKVTTDSPATSASIATTRTEAEVRAIISAAGTTPPDWFDATSLDYPESLDLSWPLKPATKGWHAHKNMSQYIWSVINENPSRWHSGIKLVHHCVALHKNDRALLERDMRKLGTMYFTLLQDYSRAAFWFQKVNPSVRQIAGVRLAECYWRLGNRDMALSMMRGKTLALGAIKLLGDLGKIDGALQVTQAYRRSTASYQAFILAGDALRRAGRLDDAVDYYQQVIDSKNFRKEETEKRFKARARESIAAIQLFDQADVNLVSDGRYRDSSTGYAGKLSVEVLVSGGRLETVKITDHQEKQFYSALTDTPMQLLAKQSVQGIDATSGATITSQAIVNATAKALSHGATIAK